MVSTLKSIAEELLEKIFKASVAGSKGIDAVKFRANNHEHLNILDELESNRNIENRDGKYYLNLVSLSELATTLPEAESLLFRCEHLFKVLKQYYLERPGQPIILNDLAKRADLPRSDIDKALSYMIQAQIFGGWTTNFYAKEESSVTPSENFLRINTFSEAIDKLKSYRTNEPTAPSLLEIPDSDSQKIHDYINRDRINQLESIESKDFDLSRLIQICKEINSSRKNENYIALGSLLRVLIDHIPPLLGYETFKEVASNYPGKSLKATFQHLENGCRKISDGLLHQKIRKKESLPTFTQVNFSTDIDVLLGEIIRKIGEINA